MAEVSGSASQGRDRRTLLGQLVQPKKQFKFAFFFIGAGMVILTLFIAITLYFVQNTITALEIAYHLDHDIVVSLSDSLMGMLTVALLVSIIFTVISMLFGLQTTHRFYGPQVSLLRQIDELKKGNFSARVHLRRADELTDIQNGLNELAESLEKKYPKA